MSKKVFKYFIDFLDGQEKWLNEMSAKGFRLINTSKLYYEFESCKANEYEYKIEFISHISKSERDKYISFLNELDYNILTKNINLNYSIGKVKWRPYANKDAKFATPDTYNKELLIIERKKETKPFEIHTDITDLIDYFKPTRNMHLVNSIALLLLAIYGFITLESSNFFKGGISLLVLILGTFFLAKTFKYSKLLSTYKKQAKLHE